MLELVPSLHRLYLKQFQGWLVSIGDRWVEVGGEEMAVTSLSELLQVVRIVLEEIILYQTIDPHGMGMGEGIMGRCFSNF